LGIVKLKGYEMKETNLTNNELSLIGVSVAGAVSVAASGGKFDLTDTAVGILLLFMLYPVIVSKKSSNIRKIISLASGMCLLLVFGFLVEIFGPKIWKESKYQLFHFIFWIISSFASFLVIKKLEKQHNKTLHSDS
jgi:hypothetical protein